MPKCIVQGCHHKSGKKTQYPDVILHVFPNNLERIKRWLQQTGQEFKDLDGYAQCILDEKKNDNYRICSDHFAPECYMFRGSTKALREDAVPTKFPDSKGRPLIKESTFGRSHAKKLRLQTVAQEQASTSEFTMEPAAFRSHADCYRKYLAGMKRDASTQTEVDCITSDQAVQSLEAVMPVKVDAALPNNNTNKETMAETLPFCDERTSCFGQNCSVGVSNVQSQRRKAPCFPLETTHEVRVTIEDISEEDMVKERKFLVFESCLDTLFYKLPCGAGVGCTAPVGGLRKDVDGSFLSVTGYCINGHQFKLWQSQPCLERVAAGNLLLSAAILLSGSNFKEVHEMNDLLGMQQLSEKAYCKYQKEFLFGTIDHHWRLEHQRVKEKIGKKPLCIAGDGIYSSSKSTAKYCSYTMIDLASQKVVDFKVSPPAPSRSLTAERAFQNCLNKILEEDFKVRVVATDRHAGIEKVMREQYADVNHQHKVCNYVKDLNKRLVSASKKKMGENIGLWIHPIINHFWWSIKTCGGDGNMLCERWQSLLYHVTDQHSWKDLERYRSCAHKPLTQQEGKAIGWLKKDSPAYKHLQEIVKDPQLTKYFPLLSNGCHGGSVVAFRSHMRKYRASSALSRASMEARTKLAILAHNNNVAKLNCKPGRIRMPMKCANRCEMQKTGKLPSRFNNQWLGKAICGKTSNTHLKGMLTDLLRICNGKLVNTWKHQSAAAAHGSVRRTRRRPIRK